MPPHVTYHGVEFLTIWAAISLSWGELICAPLLQYTLYPLSSCQQRLNEGHGPHGHTCLGVVRGSDHDAHSAAQLLDAVRHIRRGTHLCAGQPPTNTLPHRRTREQIDIGSVLQEGRSSKTGESLRVVASVVANQHLERAAVLDLLHVLVQTLSYVSHKVLLTACT
jgi:hypothetical protein